MSILTGLVIVVAMAVLSQRSESLAKFFTRDEVAKIAPQNDEAVMFAGESRLIDVLANDENALPEDRANVRIVVSPSCGAAEATSDGVLYIANDRCIGPQLFAYCVARGDECASASVTVAVAAAVADRSAPAPAAQASPAPTVAQAPASAPALQQPAAQQLANQQAEAPASEDTIRTQDSAETFGQVRPVIAAINPVAPSQPISPEMVQQLESLTRPAAAPSTPLRIPVAPSPITLEDSDDGTLLGLDAPSGGVPAAPAQTAGQSAPVISANPPVEVASLADPEESSVASRVQDEAVERARTASLPAANAPAPTGEGCGPARVSSTAVSGGSSRIAVNSPCRAGKPLEIEHAGLYFGGIFDLAGNAEIILPVMDDKLGARAVFDDGAATEYNRLAVNLNELELTLRVALTWSAPIDLNLHAFEYAAAYGADGHVWQEQPRGFRIVRRAGGGFLANYPATKADGQSVEVYTFWANSRARRGTMRIALEHASRGDRPDGAFCGAGPLASPAYTVIQSERGKVVSTRRGRFAPAECGQELSTELRYVSGALRDLEIE